MGQTEFNNNILAKYRVKYASDTMCCIRIEEILTGLAPQ